MTTTKSVLAERRPLIPWHTLLASVALASPTAHAADFLVPDDFPLPIAVQLACMSADPVNHVLITERVTITATITIDGTCDGTKTVIVRPEVYGERATIESAHADPAFLLAGCEGVRFRDLDIVRTWPNSTDLIDAVNPIDCVIERCRLGSVLFVRVPGTGTDVSIGTHREARQAAASVLSIAYPKDVVVRNTVCFSTPPGSFDRGIEITNMTDVENSIFLYNNVVGDHAEIGISVQGGALPGPLALLRNNVVVNHVDLAVEPVAYRSDFLPPGEVVTSHNVALASVGLVEQIGGGATTITGEGAPSAAFLRYDRADADDIFVDYRWFIGAWDPNEDLYRLEPAANPMHDDPDDNGQNTSDGSPDARDLVVADDIELDMRPSGFPEHTDRGVDQLEETQAGAVDPSGHTTPQLWAAPAANPSESAAIGFVSELPGHVVLEVFDVSGRRLSVGARTVAAGESGVIRPPDAVGHGVRFYRVRLLSTRGVFEVTGKFHIVG